MNNVVGKIAWIGLTSIALHASLGIDESSFQKMIREHPNDFQYRVIYARFLLENNRIAQAYDVLKGLDPKKNYSVKKILNDLHQQEADQSFLKKKAIDLNSQEYVTSITSFSPEEAEKLYAILSRHHIDISNTVKKALARKIAEGSNKFLAGSILASMPKEFSETSVKKIKATSPDSDRNEMRRSIVAVTKEVSIPVITHLKTDRELLEESLEEYAQSPSTQNVQKVAYLYSKLGRTEDQIALFKEYLKTYPFDSEIRLTLGQNLAWNRQYDEALIYLQGVEGKQRYLAKLTSGQIYSWKGDYEDAKQLLEEVKHHGNPSERFEARKSLAYIARWEGDNATAAQLFAQLNQEQPSDEEVQEEVWFDQKQFTRLIAKYEANLKKNPENKQLLQRLSSVLVLDGQFEKALYYLDREYRKNNDPALLKEMGNISLRMKQTEEGLLYWKKYAESLNTPKSWFEYAQNLFWVGKNSEALDTLLLIRHNGENDGDVEKLIQQISKITESSGVQLHTEALPQPSLQKEEQPDLGNEMQEEEKFADFLRQKGKFSEASRLYRRLYLKSGDIKYGRAYMEMLQFQGKDGEASAIAEMLNIDEIPFPRLDNKVEESQKKDIPLTRNEPVRVNLKTGVAVDRLKDSNGLEILQGKIIGEYVTDSDYILRSEIGRYQYKSTKKRIEGTSAFVSLGKENWEGGVFFDTVGSKGEFNPYLRASFPLAPHTLSLSAQRRNIGFSKYAITPFEEHNSFTSLTISDYALFENGREFWGAAEFGRDENGNMIFTPQFQYRFYQFELPIAVWSLSTSGWYTFNSQPTDAYYSPSFADATYVSNGLNFPMAERFNLELNGALGYSFNSETSLYKIGAWIDRKIDEGWNLKLGCSDNSSFSGSSTSVPYSYSLCNALIYYRW
ncbi:MAG: hypothetical protein PHO52_07575 [Sulfuricurvum sp.]|uniref:tetratricopeptide repeat protein n=1 Tax=Sulfuricurvum sp. TaxID=2025608 RepID=UPI0026277617|nr:hypothetical protein [Sulfuricurvum sp.]MDD2784058.1 hypothetical protein [Sulfuricurvum sp.]